MERVHRPTSAFSGFCVLLTLAWFLFADRLDASTPERPQSGVAADARVTAFVGARVFPAPGVAVLENAVVLVTGGAITAVGPAETVPIPDGAQVVDTRGLSLLAGFWNCHVHFTEPKWIGAAGRPAAELNGHLEQMLTRYGFTTVVDLASDLSNTVALRARIEAGEVAGPRILTAGGALYPENGVPYYVTEVAPELASLLATPGGASEAVEVVRTNVEGGADLIKLFAVTGVRAGDGTIHLREMSADVIKAAVGEAHRHRRLVFAHPSTVAGLDLAVAGGVDVLAHTIQDTENWNAEVLARLRAADVALVPTLTLFSPMSDFSGVLAQVKGYVAAGGDVLFGTDVGFLPNYPAVAREFQLLKDAGLTFPEVLATLTTAPAARFGMADRQGRVVAGADADLVLLEGDPSRDTDASLRVRYTVRGGRILYSR